MTISTKSPKSPRQVLVGIPASPGFVMGRAFQVASREITVVEDTIPESRIAAEEELFRRAVTRTSKEIAQIKEISETRTGVHDSLIFATHLMILQDPGLVNGILNMIRKDRKNARWALHVVLGGYIDNFEKIDSPAMRDKAADLRDLYNRLMAAMDEAGPALQEVSGEDGAVIVAHEILPSFLMALKPGQARALLMDTGGRTSHVAILARSLQIPVVSGLRNVFGMNARLAALASIVIPLVVGASFLFHRKIASRFLECDENEGKLSTIVQENLTGVCVIRAFGREQYEVAKFDAQNRYYVSLWVRLGRVLSLFWVTGDLIAVLQVLLLLVCGSVFAIRGELTAGEFIAFLSYNGMLMFPIRHLGRMISELSKAGISLNRIREIMASPEETDPPDALTPPLDGDIVFDHVSFGYDGCLPLP